MKILLIHNFYQASCPLGEDAVVKAEIELLKARGVEVVTFAEHNHEIINFSKYKKATLPLRLLWSKETFKQLKDLIKKEKPDVAHFHNIFYLISPSAYYACKQAGIPVVQTLHNFRFFCLNGLMVRGDKLCEKCVGKSSWRGIVHGCYRGARLYSLPVALMESFHRFLGTWESQIDVYIALTEFGKKKFVECGLPAEKIFVKPNLFLNSSIPRYSHDGYTAFLGRLFVENGGNTLINAFRILNSHSNGPLTLKIIGDGPTREPLEDKVKAEQIRGIEFTGIKSFDQCMELLQGARFILVPSICYEGFPMAIREAFACGKPVIASTLGAMAELVEDGKTGLHFEPGNPQDLASKIKWMLDNEAACMEMGKNARAEFEAKYTADRNYKILMDIYQQAVEKNIAEKRNGR